MAENQKNPREQNSGNWSENESAQDRTNQNQRSGSAGTTGNERQERDITDKTGTERTGQERQGQQEQGQQQRQQGTQQQGGLGSAGAERKNPSSELDDEDDNLGSELPEDYKQQQAQPNRTGKDSQQARDNQGKQGQGDKGRGL